MPAMLCLRTSGVNQPGRSHLFRASPLSGPIRASSFIAALQGAFTFSGVRTWIEIRPKICVLTGEALGLGGGAHGVIS